MEEKKPRKKRKLGSYPFLSVIFSISVALMVLGLFGWIVLHTAKLGKKIQESVEVQVYLNKNISQSDIVKLRSILSSKSFVLVDGQPLIKLISREEAAKQFIADTGEDFKDFLGENPLRDLFAINIAGSYQSVDSLAMIKKEVEDMYGVFEVEYEANLIEEINKNLFEVGMILLSVAALALIAAIISINNTIKLALFSQRFLIRSMQLVGATNVFIRRPFVLRAMWYGFIAGLLACIAIYSFTRFLNRAVIDLSNLQDGKAFIALFVFIVITGMLVGFLSSFRAIKKYLKMSLDELY